MYFFFFLKLQTNLAVLQDRLCRALGPSAGIQVVSSPFHQVNILPEGAHPSVGQAQQSQAAKSAAVSRGGAVQQGVPQGYQTFSNVPSTTATTPANYYTQNQYSYPQQVAPVSTPSYTPQQPDTPAAPITSAHKGESG